MYEYAPSQTESPFLLSYFDVLESPVREGDVQERCGKNSTDHPNSHVEIRGDIHDKRLKSYVLSSLTSASLTSALPSPEVC